MGEGFKATLQNITVLNLVRWKPHMGEAARNPASDEQVQGDSYDKTDHNNSEV